jgi:flagellar protein FliS
MNPYFEQMILSASPVGLIRLLYQKAIASVRDARESLREGRIADRCAAINKAYAVLTELSGSLRAEEASDLAGRLKNLYSYMQAKLVEANTQQSDVPMAEVLGLLTTLSEAWNQIPDTTSAEHEIAPELQIAEAADGAVRYAVSA